MKNVTFISMAGIPASPVSPVSLDTAATSVHGMLVGDGDGDTESLGDGESVDDTDDDMLNVTDALLDMVGDAEKLDDDDGLASTLFELETLVD